jgi:hypothetical protein
MGACAQGVGNGDAAGSSPGDQDPATTATPPETTTPASTDTSTTTGASTTTTPGVTSPSEDRIPEAPRFFTIATPSGSYTLTLDGTSTLQLPPDTPQPTVSGTSVLVMDVASLTNTGNKQWELRAVQAGETTISVETPENSKTWTLIVRE